MGTMRTAGSRGWEVTALVADAGQGGCVGSVVATSRMAATSRRGCCSGGAGGPLELGATSGERCGLEPVCLALGVGCRSQAWRAQSDLTCEVRSSFGRPQPPDCQPTYARACACWAPTNRSAPPAQGLPLLLIRPRLRPFPRSACCAPLPARHHWRARRLTACGPPSTPAVLLSQRSEVRAAFETLSAGQGPLSFGHATPPRLCSPRYRRAGFP